MSARGGRAARLYYRLLLLAYPREFRRRDGAEAAGLFAQACRDSRRRAGLAAVARRVLHAGAEVPRRGLGERLRRGPSLSLRPPPRRRAGLFGELVADLRVAARGLRRRPGWTLAIAATLALGIGANAAIFSVVDATLLASSPWPDADRLALVDLLLSESDTSMHASLGELLRWRDQVAGFARLEAIDSRPAVLSHATGARSVTLSRVTSGYLDVLGVEPLVGRLLRADDGRADAPAVVVMPERTWRRLYGADPGIVGDTVDLGGLAHEVIGVMPEVRGMAPEFMKPLPAAGAPARDADALGLAWLRPGVSLEQAAAQLAAVSHGEDARWGPYVARLRAPRNTFWDQDEFRSALLALTAAVFLVLTIACVNVASLLLAAAGARGGELAVRAALGAGRARLVRFMLAESLLLAALGGALGLVVARGGIALMQRMAPGGQLGDALQRVRLDGGVLAYATLIAVVAALAFGLLPALRSAPGGQRGPLQEANPRAGGGRRRLRGAMVAAETALSLVLLVAAGLTARSFLQLRFTDPGFDADRIMSLWILPPEARYPGPARKAAFFESLRSELARVPGVEAVSLAAGAVPPSDLITGGEMVIEGRQAAIETTMTVSMVEGDLLAFMGIPLLAGRDLSGQDVRNARAGGDKAVVINRSLARRYWPEGDAVGARFRLSLDHDQRWNRVVGIAADVRQRGLEVPPDGLHLYTSLGDDRRYGEVLLRLRPATAPPLAEVRAAINRIDPQVPTDTLDTAAAGMLDSMSNTRFRAALFGAFGALAVALAALGIAGVVAYTVVQRTAEMGIRLALGAAPSDVRRLVLLQGSAPVLLGIGVGLLLSLAVTRLMAGFLHGVRPVDPLTFAATAALLAGIGALATWVPARRATTVDPVATLRRG